MEITTRSVQQEIGGRTLTIETGRLAHQAGGAVTVQYGETMMLGTATASKPRPGIDFFPLSVEFEERLYAAGRIPGSFFRREGRPTTSAVLSARLTDRPIRPLFPKGYNDDTQLIITIFAVDMENPPDTLGTIAASAALCVSDIPFDGPVASVRIGHVDGELVLQPTFAELEASDLNLVVAGTRDAITMVEADAGEVPESLLVDALALGQEAIATICEMQEALAAEVSPTKRAYEGEAVDAELVSAVDAQVGADLRSALRDAEDKADRDNRRRAVKEAFVAGLDEEADAEAHKDAFDALEKQIVRRSILEEGVRPDGRGHADLRPLSAETGLVPRTHGSGLFQRGETQVLSFTTLAGSGMAQRLDDLTPEDSKRFMHHYNFPPFSTGETGRVGNPSRRSIGHGMLGERAMTAILPSFEEFPYTIRVVSEVLASNGSTSMASVCASVLSMMDAGVPIRTPIAGIAMGLIKEDEEVAILTDIVGMEDHLGDMDFKVAGSREGVTALQMDMKVKGIDLEILARALEQARDARLAIMDVMIECISEPRGEMSPHAPRILRLEVPQDKIGSLIGPGGKTIRGLQEETGADISVEDDGSVYITAVNQASGQAAYEKISAMTRDIEPGQIYTGKVVRILPFGAFVEMVPGKDALVHISELADYHVDKVEDIVSVGDEMQIIVIEVDNLGRVNASRKELLNGGGGDDGGGGRRREREPRGERSDRGDRGDRGGDRGPRSRDRRDDRGPRREREPRQRRQRMSRDEQEERGDRVRSRYQEEDDERPSAAVVEPSDAAEAVAATPEVEQESPDLAAAESGAVEAASEVPAGAVEPSTAEPSTAEPSEAEPRALDAPAAEGSAAVAPPDGQPRRRRRRRRRNSQGQSEDGGSAGSEGNRGQRGPSEQRSQDGGQRDGNRDGNRDSNRGGQRGNQGGGEGGRERQPDSNVAPRRRGGLFSRMNIRREQPESDGPPPPPPPPRSDFGAPNR